MSFNHLYYTYYKNSLIIVDDIDQHLTFCKKFKIFTSNDHSLDLRGSFVNLKKNEKNSKKSYQTYTSHCCSKILKEWKCLLVKVP